MNMKLISAFTISFFSFLLISITSCNEGQKPDDPLKSFTEQQRDSLLADIITYIYVKPSGADKQTRFTDEFRSYYVEQLPKFNWLWHHESASGEHLLYLIRPARNIHGHKRGVCGKFRLDATGKIAAFEELFNTPIMPEEEVAKKGKVLFAEVLKTGGFDKYHLNKDFIEFPDERTFYDKEILEWSYKK